MDDSALMKAREAKLDESRQYYSYQPPELVRIEGLEKRSIWASDPSGFNDLLDMKHTIMDWARIDFAYDRPERLKSAVKTLIGDGNYWYWMKTEEIDHALKEWLETSKWPVENLIPAIQRRLSSFGVSCLTNNPDHPLMWAHYSDKHYGFSIEYCLNFMDLSAYDVDILGVDCQYTSSSPEFCFTEFLFNPRQTLLRALSTKKVEWAYENEYRIIHREKQNQQVAIARGLEITALIAGRRASASTLSALKHQANLMEVPCLRWVDKRLHKELVAIN